MHGWLILHPNAAPTLCIEDPLLAEERYLYVEADTAGIYPVARGLRRWTDAIADGSVQIYGDPELIRGLPGWFKSTDRPMRTPVEATVAVA